MTDPTLTNALDPAEAPRLLAAACDRIRGLENQTRQLNDALVAHVSCPYFALSQRIGRLRKKLLPPGSNRDSFVRWILKRSRRRPPPPPDPYAIWIARHEAPAFAHMATPSRAAPCIHFLLAGDAATTQATVKSLLAQTDPQWQLVLTVEKPLDVEDARIRVIAADASAASAVVWNRALKSASDGFVAVLRPGNQLAPVAVAALRLALEKGPGIGMIYSDEDALDEAGQRCDPLFKPDWSPETFRAVDYIGNLTAFSLPLVREVGGFRPEFGEAAVYDLALRVSEKTKAIGHAPMVLCHSPKTSIEPRSLASHRSNETRAVQEHLNRLQIAGEVSEGPPPQYSGEGVEKAGLQNPLAPHLRPLSPVRRGEGRPVVRQVRYQVSRPLISIIIPSKDQPRLLERCVDTLLASEYPNQEIVLADTGSLTPEAREVNGRLASRPGVRLLRWDRPFNYSAVNNFAVRQARGEVLVFLNDDTEVITPDWLERMLEFALQPRVGIVGAKLLYANGTIQHAGLVVGTIGGICDHLLRYAPDDDAHARRLGIVRNVSAVTAACLMMRRSVFDEVGGFDEKFAGDFNDVDLCLKAGQSGYQVIWTPYARLFHHECQTRGHIVNPRRHNLYALERLLFLDRWGAVVARGDPFYNPNLNHNDADCTLRR